MPRLARVIVPGLPLHITQRGNRRQQTFFRTEDYLLYVSVLAERCKRYGVDIWAYCLMPNHSHLIAVPQTADGLRRAIGEAHRRYTREVNKEHGWLGHLWQGRFSSFVMDEAYTIEAARYIELNPVAANLVSRPEEYRWSSARAHLLGYDDVLVKRSPLLASVGDWSAFLQQRIPPDQPDRFRRHETTGRPLGDPAFIEALERRLGRTLRPRKPGPVPRRQLERSSFAQISP